MRIDFFERWTDPKTIGIHDELLAMPERSMQSRYTSVLYNLVGYIIGYLLLVNRFDNRIGCFLWYVILPVIFNILSVWMFRTYLRRTKDKDPEYYSSLEYIIPGACVEWFAYSYIVVIYRSVPQVWILAFLPVLLACYFKGTRWFKVQTVIQSIFIAVMLTIKEGVFPYEPAQVSPLIRGVFFAIAMFQFSHALIGQDNIKRGIYANISTEEARMEVRRVYESNLRDDCRPYLNKISSAAEGILNDNEDDNVREYALRLAHAGEVLKEAVGNGKD